MSNAIREEIKRKPVTFSRLFKSAVQKAGSITIEVKQEIKKISYYPSKKFGNNLQDSLFSDSEFGVKEEAYEAIEKRVAWIQAPDGVTEQQVLKRLADNPQGCIYKILSNAPILSDNQKIAIKNGLKTMDDFAMTQCVRYPDSHEKGGELILDATGKIQYKQTFYSKDAKNDIDLRGNGDVYAPEELLEEVEGAAVYQNQSIDNDNWEF